MLQNRQMTVEDLRFIVPCISKGAAGETEG
jgi:hypothetical protein